MTVQELINTLSELDPSLPVVFADRDTYGYPFYLSEVYVGTNRDPYDSDFDYRVVVLK